MSRIIYWSVLWLDLLLDYIVFGTRKPQLRQAYESMVTAYGLRKDEWQ